MALCGMSEFYACMAINYNVTIVTDPGSMPIYYYNYVPDFLLLTAKSIAMQYTSCAGVLA